MSPPSRKKFGLPSHYRNQTTNVWDTYMQLALDYKPLNLGMGCPDFAAPKHVAEALSKVALDEDAGLSQYARGNGHLRLVKVLAGMYSNLLGRELDPLKEVIVTTGAYGALYASILGHVDEGDEVIIIEPYFDCYQSMVLAARGIPKFVPLRKTNTSEDLCASQWKLDFNELENAFNSKTKLIILNTPHNPIGKVFSREELEEIAQLCIKWDVVCISDEVYEWLVFGDNVHVRMATLPEMWDRTITIGSGGKTFSVTGWKIGWAYGPSDLLFNLQVIHQNSASSCSTPLQEAIAVSMETELTRLDSENCYFKVFVKDMQRKRDYMVDFLKRASLNPVIPDGGYFVLADWSSWENVADMSEERDQQKDFRFTKWMIKNVGVQAIPSTAFFSESDKHLSESYVRFCFIKTDEKLRDAGKTLENWYKSHQK